MGRNQLHKQTPFHHIKFKEKLLGRIPKPTDVWPNELSCEELKSVKILKCPSLGGIGNIRNAATT